MKKEKVVRNHLVGHVSNIKGIVRKISSDQSTIDDLTQECCMRIIEKEGTFNGQEDMLSRWMNAISRNVIFRELSKRKKAKAESLSEETLTTSDEKDFVDEDVFWLMGQVKLLDKRQKQIIHLHYFEEMKVGEIAVKLGISHQAVSKQLKQAVSVIRAKKTAEGGFAFVLPLLLTAASPWKWQSTSFVAATLVFGTLSLGAFALSQDSQLQSETQVIIADGEKSSHRSNSKIVSVAMLGLKGGKPIFAKPITRTVIPESLVTHKTVLQAKAQTLGSPGENKAHDLKIKSWVNRDELLARLTREYKKEWGNSVIGNLITPAMKSQVQGKFDGKIEDYLALRLPEKSNILDKSRNFFVVFLNFKDADAIKELNALQKRHLDKVTICAIMQPLVPRVPVNAEEPRKFTSEGTAIDFVDPTFSARNYEAYKKLFSQVKGKKQKEIPNFLVGFDETRFTGVEGSGPQYDHYFVKYQFYNKSIYSETISTVINKRSELIWMGKLKDADYYLKTVSKNTFNWSLYRGGQLTKSDREKYFGLVSNPSYINQAQEHSLTFFKDMSHSPELLIEFVETILAKDLFHSKDMNLAFKACQQLNKLLGENDPRLQVLLIKFYAVNGDLEKLKMTAKKLKLEYATKLNARSYKAYRQAELNFANLYWPYLKKAENAISEEEARKLEKALQAGFMRDKKSFAKLVDSLMKKGKSIYKNKEFMKFINPFLNASIKSLKGRPAEEADHEIYAAYAMYQFRLDKIDASLKLMNKALKCVSMGKDKKTKNNYISYIDQIRKKRRN
jgi:RNA polymerase sigma factor (sigma-70 family)